MTVGTFEVVVVVDVVVGVGDEDAAGVGNVPKHDEAPALKSAQNENKNTLRNTYRITDIIGFFDDAE